VIGDPIVVPYRLAVSSCRFHATAQKTMNVLIPPGEPGHFTTDVAAVGTMAVSADPRLDLSLKLDVDDYSKLTVVLSQTEDGRFSDASGDLDAQADSHLKAILTSAAFAGAAGVSLGGPLLGVPAAIAGGLGALLFTNVAADEAPGELNLLGPDEVQIDQPNPFASLPPSTEVGIDPRYEHAVGEIDFKLLVGLRVAEARLRASYAAKALDAYKYPGTSAEQLRELRSTLTGVRSELTPYEARYAQWLAGKVTTTTTILDRELYVDQLPTAAQVEAAAADPPESSDAPVWWARVAHPMHLIVSCDLLVPEPDEGGSGRKGVPPERSSDGGTIVYRRPVPALMRTWRLTEIDTDNDDPLSYTAKLVETQWALVTHPDFWRTLTIPLEGTADAVVKATFANSGALTGLTATRTGVPATRSAMLAELPGALSAAATGGSGLATALSPLAAKAARVKAQSDIADAEAKLSPPTTPEDVKDKRDQLIRSELDARLAIAQMVAADPTKLVFGIASIGS